jgi:plasmid stability protein
MVKVAVLRLDDDLYSRLRARSKENGGSLEEVACHILKEVLNEDPPPPPEKPMTGKEFVEGIRKLVEPFGGIELEIPPRTPIECPHCHDRRPK